MKKILLFMSFPFILFGQSQIGVDIDGDTINDLLGFSVSLSTNGNIVAIGGPFNDGNGTDSGHVRIYENIGGIWTQIGNDIDGEAAGDQSGFGLSLTSDGSIIVIGARFNDGNGSDSGHVRVYDLSALLSSDEFILTQFNIYPNPAKDQFTINLQQGLELQAVNIYNNLGQFISATTKIIVDTTGLSSGLYYVEVITNKGKASKKLMIE